MIGLGLQYGQDRVRIGFGYRVVRIGIGLG